MKVESVKIADLRPDPKNVRLHGTRNLESLARSLREFGQQKPILIGKDNAVIAGHGTLEAASSLGWTKIDCVRSALDGSKAKAYAVADNQTALTSEWDYEGLADLLKSLESDGLELDVLGFADFELGPLLAAEWTPPAPGPMPGGDRDDGQPSDGDTGSQADPQSSSAVAVLFSREAYAVVKEACDHIRAGRGEPDWSDAAALEMIARDYLDVP